MSSAMFARRAALRAALRSRTFASASSSGAKSSYHEQQAALSAHAAETTELWRKISFYVCIPAIAVCAIWVRNVEAEHEAHQKHLYEANGGRRPEPPAYEYLNRRTSGPFPWGNNSLFFNPEVQKDLDAVAEE